VVEKKGKTAICCAGKKGTPALFTKKVLGKLSVLIEIRLEQKGLPETGIGMSAGVLGECMLS